MADIVTCIYLSKAEQRSPHILSALALSPLPTLILSALALSPLPNLILSALALSPLPNLMRG